MKIWHFVKPSFPLGAAICAGAFFSATRGTPLPVGLTALCILVAIRVLPQTVFRVLAALIGVSVGLGLIARAGFTLHYTASEAALVLATGTLWAGGLALVSFGRTRFGTPLISGVIVITVAFVTTLAARTHVNSVVLSSRYVTVRDGTRIAIDVNLPRRLGSDQQVPTIIHQTRYYRNKIWSGPRYLVEPPYQALAKPLTDAGYAYVRVDVRGTGASGGNRPGAFSPEEIRDGYDIVDWIVNQPWSDGTVGSEGISYPGSTAEFLLSVGHPAVKAASVNFALYDGATDIGRPGGIHLDVFRRLWSSGNAALDQNKAQHSGSFLESTATVRPVDADPSGKILGEMIKSRKNWDSATIMASIQFRDSPDSTRTGESFRYRDAINRSGAAIYSVSGWYDGGYPTAAIKRFLNTRNTKVLIGPWDHGGRQNISPCSDDGASPLNYADHLIAFFDDSLRGSRDKFREKPNFRYFTLCGSGWQSSDVWPPASAQSQLLFLDSGRLSADVPATNHIHYDVDLTTTTGQATRWFSLTNTRRLPIRYTNRQTQASRLVIFDSAAFSNGVEITGNPVIQLYLSANADDAHIFAYLEDVAPDGEVTYITEGQLSSRNRKLASAEDALYADPGPHRTYLSRDALPLAPGEIARHDIGFQSISYFVRPDHRIRVSLAGADADNFAVKEGIATEWEIYEGEKYPSKIILPVVSH